MTDVVVNEVEDGWADVASDAWALLEPVRELGLDGDRLVDVDGDDYEREAS